LQVRKVSFFTFLIYTIFIPTARLGRRGFGVKSRNPRGYFIFVCLLAGGHDAVIMPLNARLRMNYCGHGQFPALAFIAFSASTSNL